MTKRAYNQVFNALKAQIMGCFYAPGQKIPPERTLCEEFGVSRITARHALRLLEEQGLVERFRGRGTFVRAIKPKKIPLLTGDFTGSVRSQALNMKRKLLVKENATPPSHIANILGLKKTQQCLLAIRLDLLDDKPLAYDRAYILSEFAGSLDDKILTAIDFLELWLEREGINTSNHIENIEAVEADSQTVEYLDVVAGSAMLLATDICYNADSKAIAVFESVYRGDCIKLVSTTNKGTVNQIWRRQLIMKNRERALAVLNYNPYDRLPIVHFGFWPETLQKWYKQGHITAEEANGWNDGTPIDRSIGEKLGFDFNWYNCLGMNCGLNPLFEEKILEEFPDGKRKILNADGVIVLQKKDTASIPAEIDHLLKTRKEWEEFYLPKLQFSWDRILKCNVNTDKEFIPFDKAGLEYLKSTQKEHAIGLHCGSLLGQIRDWVGVEGLSYLYVDDAKLYDEIINTVGELCYECVEAMLSTGAKFDFAHFWEDMCFKNGPLVVPSVFEEKVGPHYKRITDIVKNHGIEIVSVDCDGMIDALIPTWLNNGVNTMFPIEVGTWNASIKPWREKYGRELRGVGGMNKTAFAMDYTAIDTEIERLKPLVALGGYIPCPDHRIAPDAKWENVRYYCEKMRQTFGG